SGPGCSHWDAELPKGGQSLLEAPLPLAFTVKVSAWNAGDQGSIPGSGRSPGEGNGNPLQYSCLENPMVGYIQGTLKSLLQHYSSNASILQRSAFFTIQFSHPYMTTGKTIALTRRTL
ncbi:hypothetical protein JEQ12_009190, partial [Ovis aries]